MDNKELAEGLIRLAKEIMGADTFKCPECGGKVLEQTKYCVKCKKKVEPKKRSAANTEAGQFEEDLRKLKERAAKLMSQADDKAKRAYRKVNDGIRAALEEMKKISVM